MTDLRDALAVVAEMAPALRQAGVSVLKLGDLELALHPDVSEFEVKATHDERVSLPAELDPATYQGRGVPGYPRPEDGR